MAQTDSSIWTLNRYFSPSHPIWEDWYRQGLTGNYIQWKLNRAEVLSHFAKCVSVQVVKQKKPSDVSFFLGTHLNPPRDPWWALDPALGTTDLHTCPTPSHGMRTSGVWLLYGSTWPLLTWSVFLQVQQRHVRHRAVHIAGWMRPSAVKDECCVLELSEIFTLCT